MLKIGTWNILADSLSQNEFLCHTEEELIWNIRGEKILKILCKMLESINIIILQECDKFEYFLNYFKTNIMLLEKNIVIIWKNVEFICFDKKSYLFSFDNKIFNIYPLHLKSGEAIEQAKLRIEKLEELFIDANTKLNPIFIMDSNNSEYYELNYPDEYKMSNLIMKYEYKNTLITKGNECFKLRHNKGNQPQKFYQLMFDTIDKILVKNNINVINQSIEDFGFQRYNPENYNEILNIRLNKRKDFTNECLLKKSYETDSHIFFENIIFHDLYPNTKAPSDHPPISVTIELI